MHTVGLHTKQQDSYINVILTGLQMAFVMRNATTRTVSMTEEIVSMRRRYTTVIRTVFMTMKPASISTAHFLPYNKAMSYLLIQTMTSENTRTT